MLQTLSIFSWTYFFINVFLIDKTLSPIQAPWNVVSFTFDKCFCHNKEKKKKTECINNGFNSKIPHIFWKFDSWKLQVISKLCWLRRHSWNCCSYCLLQIWRLKFLTQLLVVGGNFDTYRDQDLVKFIRFYSGSPVWRCPDLALNVCCRKKETALLSNPFVRASEENNVFFLFLILVPSYFPRWLGNSSAVLDQSVFLQIIHLGRSKFMLVYRG